MIDIQRVTEYNNKYKQAKESYSKLNAEIEFSQRELSRLCQEISTELGETVTPQNIIEVYKRETEKIEKTLQVGEEILGRITGQTAVNPGTNPQVAGQTPVSPVPSPVQPVQSPVQPVQSTPQAPVQPSSDGPVFTTGGANTAQASGSNGFSPSPVGGAEVSADDSEVFGNLGGIFGL